MGERLFNWEVRWVAHGPYVVKSRFGCASLPKRAGEERQFSSSVQDDGLLGAYVGWRNCAENIGLVVLQGSSSLTEVVLARGTCSRHGASEAGDSQKAAGKAM